MDDAARAELVKKNLGTPAATQALRALTDVTLLPTLVRQMNSARAELMSASNGWTTRLAAASEQIRVALARLGDAELIDLAERHDVWEAVAQIRDAPTIRRLLEHPTPTIRREAAKRTADHGARIKLALYDADDGVRGAAASVTRVEDGAAWSKDQLFPIRSGGLIGDENLRRNLFEACLGPFGYESRHDRIVSLCAETNTYNDLLRFIARNGFKNIAEERVVSYSIDGPTTVRDDLFATVVERLALADISDDEISDVIERCVLPLGYETFKGVIAVVYGQARSNPKASANAAKILRRIATVFGTTDTREEARAKFLELTK